MSSRFKRQQPRSVSERRGLDCTEERSDFLSKIVHFITAATGTAAAAGYGGCESWLTTEINNGAGTVLFKPMRKHKTR